MEKINNLKYYTDKLFLTNKDVSHYDILNGNIVRYLLNNKDISDHRILYFETDKDNFYNNSANDHIIYILYNNKDNHPLLKGGHYDPARGLQYRNTIENCNINNVQRQQNNFQFNKFNVPEIASINQMFDDYADSNMLFDISDAFEIINGVVIQKKNIAYDRIINDPNEKIEFYNWCHKEILNIVNIREIFTHHDFNEEKTWEKKVLIYHLENNKYAHNGINSQTWEVIDGMMNLLSFEDKFWCYEYIHTYLHYLDEINMGTGNSSFDIRTLYPMFVGEQNIKLCFDILANIHRTAFLKKDETKNDEYLLPYGIQNDAVQDKFRQYGHHLTTSNFVFLLNSVFKENLENGKRDDIIAKHSLIKQSKKRKKNQSSIVPAFIPQPIIPVNYTGTTIEPPILPPLPPL